MMNDKCGYCGFINNAIEDLMCKACEHSPWTQYIPYSRENDLFLDELMLLIEFGFDEKIKIVEE